MEIRSTTPGPAFAASGATGPNIVATPFGTFNLNPGPGDTLIPRNYAVGPGQFQLEYAVRQNL